MAINWHETRVSQDGTHHLHNGTPFYSKRFISVLKFHAPGLAPVTDETGAYHIDIEGKAIYPQRYFRTFGFYEGKAAADTGDDGWLHVLSDGTPLYSERYQWCGNFQENRCAVRDYEGKYFHLDEQGHPAYKKRWRYAGDFRDRIAAVQNDEGLHSHIRKDGELLHGKWFSDLDVFHKGLARARDEQGWFHINPAGKAVYERRFRQAEPFYNGQARVETFGSGLEIINEQGKTLHILRPDQRTPLQILSSDMVGFWRTQIIRSAAELRIFQFLPAKTESIAQKTGLTTDTASRFLRALWELGLVAKDENGFWSPTEKGALLKPESGMDAAAVFWGTGHYLDWYHLTDILTAKRQQTESGKNFFETISGESLDIMHRALSAYAVHDYADIPKMKHWKTHRHVIDAGGGNGKLLFHLLRAHPHLTGTLIQLPAVAEKISPPKDIAGRLNIIGASLFEPWPVQADAVIFARVLHDWPDDKARQLLTEAGKSLQSVGRLYAIEMILPEDRPDGGLLDIHMMVGTGGKERTLQDWKKLFEVPGFHLDEVIPVRSVCSVISGRKK